MSPFLPRNRGETIERQACGLAQAYEKEDQPEGLNAQADQVLSWLEQNTACVWDGLLRGQIAKKSDLLLRSRCSCSPSRCRRSLSFTCFSSRFSMRLTRFSTRFYTLATMCLRWGWRCGLGNRSLRRARGWCRVRCENAGFSDKADGQS